MLPVILILLAVTAVISLLMPAVCALEVYRTRRGVRQVTCPETKRVAAVEIDALHCAATSLAGTEYMRLSGCSRWPEKKNCDQDCVYELFQPNEVEVVHRPALPHVTILTGAGLAWLLGAFWYADPVFGRTWMRLHGLTQEAARARAESIAPYLVPAAGFVVVGYVIALLQRRIGHLGTARAVAFAVAACAGFMILDLLLRQLLPGAWLALSWVEMTYALAGCALTAAVVSGWPGLREKLIP